jgi:hypothetical protein
MAGFNGGGAIDCGRALGGTLEGCGIPGLGFMGALCGGADEACGCDDDVAGLLF